VWWCAAQVIVRGNLHTSKPTWTLRSSDETWLHHPQSRRHQKKNCDGTESAYSAPVNGWGAWWNVVDVQMGSVLYQWSSNVRLKQEETNSQISAPRADRCRNDNKNTEEDLNLNACCHAAWIIHQVKPRREKQWQKESKKSKTSWELTECFELWHIIQNLSGRVKIGV